MSMEHEDYPNYGNAFPEAVAKLDLDGQASWNPALRPDAMPQKPANTSQQTTDADDDFFERYPGATPEKLRKSRSMAALRAQQIADAGLKEQDVADGPTTEMDIAAEATVLNPVDTEPAAHYEHQGEVTALEEAIDESEAAPLMEDEQPEPRVDSFPAELQPSAPERSFTSNFSADEVTGSQQVTAPVSEDWPAVGDDKTFADLLEGSSNATDAPALEDNKTFADLLGGSGKAVHGSALEDKLSMAVQPPDGDMNAAWAAALDDDDILVDSAETDPNSFFMGDDDDFLADDFDATSTAPDPITSAYAPQTPSGFQPFSAATTNHSRSVGTPETGLYGAQTFGQPAAIPQQRPGLAQTQSFVDKPRSDYQSPYDLPIEVVKPRRRPQNATQPSHVSMPKPPPRTSSFGAPSSPTSETPVPSIGDALRGPSASKPPAENFFADLPDTTRSRSRPSGAYTPQAQQAPRTNGAMAPPQLRPSQSYAAPATQHSSMATALRQPEKAPLFPEQGPPAAQQGSPPRIPSNASLQNRYSPVLPTSSSQQTRYSPAPSDPAGRKSADAYSASPSSNAGFPTPRQAQPYLPRTSSPLATHGRPVAGDSMRRSSQYTPGSPNRNAAVSPERRDVSNASPELKRPSLDISTPSSVDGSFRPPQPYQPSFASQARPQFGQILTSKPAVTPNRLPHRRQFSKDLPYSAPNDEHAHDPLQRWKGHAIFHWSNGGLVTSSIPRQTPYYAAGSQGPSIKCTPGDVRVVEASQVLPMREVDAKFPGPLAARSKSKKKEITIWLSEKIALMMQATQAALTNFELSDADRVAADEKLVLWKVIQVYLENDGVLDGTPKLAEQIRHILLPDLAQKAQVIELQSPTSGRGGLPSDAVDTAVISQIRQALFEGRREDAVHLAEDKRLWGHAMLIASTLDPENFRQIISSFVRNQVKSQGGSEFKSLASLYQVFAGSPEDCVDELVPPSARAGFQMIDTSNAASTGEALGGLDKWRETISLVHSNPTPHNSASILAIGRLLKSYGRTDAAHTCFVFARALAKHGGADDAEADFVLLGIDAAQGSVDLESLMLTEIFEFASSLHMPANQWQYTPHLQAYKLLHGQMLAAHGSRSQAQAYCDHVDAAIKATTKPSGYYHQLFAQELIKFNEYLTQSPHVGPGGSGKFFSRPAIGKVSSGMGSWFTKFVSGDEGDTDSNTSGQGHTEGETFGPFGGVSANNLPISRTASTTDLQNPALVQSNPYAAQTSALPSRYTPQAQGSTNRYAPMRSSASVASFDSERSLSMHAPSNMPSAEPIRSASARYAPASAGNSPALLGVQAGSISRRTSNQSLVSTGSYEPRPTLAEHDGFGYSQNGDNTSVPDLPNGETHQPTASTFDDDIPQTNGFDAEAEGGYVPPTMTYEPPTADDPEDIGVGTGTVKKKSFMDDDDDDDLVSRMASLKMSKPQSSREPDPAVVAAAKADAARDAQQDKRASGWFGGWFGKKEEGVAGPVKAKLGEENSFYFDKDLNKWVNKKAGADGAASAAPTPPPPRAPTSTPSGSGPPSRNVSRAMPPPSNGPPSRQGTPATLPADGPQRTVSSSSTVTDGPGSMGPPPRPQSSMSTASSLDDLLGGPGPGRKGAAAKGKKKGGRYVDVMANAK